jgi:AcrR family transcriptional regulator
VDEAIGAAVVGLLGDVGYDELTMAGVAAAAGVSTATLYRRWRSKEDLVVGVLRESTEDTPIPDTGSLLGDCRAVLRLAFTGANQEAARKLSGLITAMNRHPTLADAIRRNLIVPRRAGLKAMLQRARERGEVAADVDDDMVIDLMFGPVYHRLLITGQPSTRRAADHLAELVTRAVEPPTAPASGASA